jgi:hypothetical protein
MIFWNILLPFGVYYGPLVFLWSFGIFWYIAPRKIWQPWSAPSFDVDFKFAEIQNVYQWNDKEANCRCVNALYLYWPSAGARRINMYVRPKVRSGVVGNLNFQQCDSLLNVVS